MPRPISWKAKLHGRTRRIGTLPGLRAPQVIKRKEEDGYGAVRAVDPQTGERKWEFKMADVTSSGILTTATDLLFTGSREGYFSASMRATGKCCGRSPPAVKSRWDR